MTNILKEFDWSCYKGVADLRFISGMTGALKSYGGINLVVLSVCLLIILRLAKLMMEYYSIWHIANQLQMNPRSIHLNGMAEYTSEILSLYYVHFNQILRVKRRVKPISMPRIRMPLSLDGNSVKMVLNEDDGRLGVKFNFDCTNTTFISAHWGVPLSIVESVLVSSDIVKCTNCEDKKDDNSIFKYIKRLLIPLNGVSGLSLLDLNRTTNTLKNNCGNISLLCNKQNYCSSEPICFSSCNDQTCSIYPTKDMVELNGVNMSIWNALTITQDSLSNKRVPLVIVLYTPRTQESRIFSEGNIETHQGHAEVVLIRFKVSNDVLLHGPFTSIPRISVYVLKQVMFSSSGLKPQEPKDMFGMGDPRDTECLICIANKMDTVLLNCGHASFCSKCLYGLRNEKCPVCRRNFNSYVKFPLKSGK